MQHWEPEYYQDYSNDDLGLTLTFFTARSNMGKKLIHRISCFEDFGLKMVIRVVCEYMKICV